MSWAIAATAGLGVANSLMQSQAQQKAQQKQADISAAQTQYSPWTHIQPQQFQPQANNATGNALAGGLQGGLAGVMQQQASQKAGAQNDLMKAQTNYYNQQSAWGQPQGQTADYDMMNKPTFMRR